MIKSCISERRQRYLSDEEKYEVIRYIQKQGPEIVIFTRGSEGSIGVFGDKTFKQPPMEVPVVDTTGSGDVFHGAFNTAYINGMSVPEAAKFATVASSIKCTRLGGIAGIPDIQTLNTFLKYHFDVIAHQDQVSLIGNMLKKGEEKQ